MKKFFQSPAVLAVSLICLFSAAIRLAYLPFATATSGDYASRVFNAWRWLSDPELITHGVWGPLHFYLIALSISIGRDPVLSPVIMQILFDALTPVLFYLFVKTEFRSGRAAVLVALSYALYPLAIHNTLGLMTQPVFSFFVMLCLLFISLARQDTGSWRHSVAAGIALTFAGMLRYEGWMLIPFLGVLLWRKPGLMLLFVVFAMVHPVFWMIGNAIHYGDPLYSMNWAANWELNLMGRADLTLAEKLDLLPGFFSRGLIWMTPLLAIISLIGAGIALARKCKARVWLVPLGGLLCLFALGIVRGSLVPKYQYTAALAIFLVPFSAVTYRALGIERYSARGMLFAAIALFGSMYAFSYPPFVPHLLPFSVNPLPWFPNQDKVVNLVVPVLKENIRDDNDGLITDFYGFVQSRYAALLTRMHPDRIFSAPGAPNQQLNADRLSDFIDKYPRGVLLLHNGSRFAGFLGYKESGKFSVKDHRLAVRKIWATPWPAFDKPALQAAYKIEHPEIQIYRYQVHTGK
jgi:hypothetical protein